MSAFAQVRNERGSWGIIGLLVVVAIILLGLYFTVLAPGGGKLSPRGRLEQASKQSGETVQVKPGQTTMGAVMDKGQDPVCRNNLAQIRSYLQMEQTNSGQFPQTLEANKIGSGSILDCHVSGKPYSYDPATGTVRCTTQGHEKF